MEPEPCWSEREIAGGWEEGLSSRHQGQCLLEVAVTSLIHGVIAHVPKAGAVVSRRTKCSLEEKQQMTEAVQGGRVLGTCWGGKNQPGLCSSTLREEGSVRVVVLHHVWAPMHASEVLSLSRGDLERGWICRAACGEEPGSLDFSLVFIPASALLF